MMIKSDIHRAWRSLFKNKRHSFINITGLSVGMVVALLIGLWIWDELSFDHYHPNIDRIAQVMENDRYNGKVHTGPTIPLPLEATLRNNYGSDFKYLVLSSWNENHVLASGDKKLSFSGTFMGADAPEMFGLRMIRGTRRGLEGSSSILISQSLAKALFAEADPLHQIVRMDNQGSFTISGVYEDLPRNTTLHDMAFIGPWAYYIQLPGNQRSLTDWGDNSLMLYVQIADHSDMRKVSEKIKDVKKDRISRGDARSQPELFLQPMNRWHLYSQFQDGINTGGAIQYVWLFGLIGAFVLCLACINFMNLSTARSEKRAREVGVRKTVGSTKSQLVRQFFAESILFALLACILSLLLVWILLPVFNEWSGKQMAIQWTNPLFWAALAAFILFTGFLAGTYPAFYLSSFNPVRVLKGSFRSGRFAALPRKFLLVLQFTISSLLIMGTLIVYKQIRFAQNRPVGYQREGLVNLELTNDDLYRHFEAFRGDLVKSGEVLEVAESNSSTTGVNYVRGDLDWQGKDPSMTGSFGNIAVSAAYGRTVGWRLIDGQDFSGIYHTDSLSLILNESAVKYMGFKKPVGETVRVGKRMMTVIGVVGNLVMESPYDPVNPTLFHIGEGPFDDLLIRISPNSSAHQALRQIETVCKTYSPSVPFSYRFADELYAKKFAGEERVGKLASVFAAIAIFISCLGLFGMASYMAEQRVKEIGVRKVLGASVVQLWAQLNKDFVVLVLIALCLAIPSSYYLMNQWLLRYTYRAGTPWWIFAATAAGTLLITVITISAQSLNAARMNPVTSLRSE